MDAISQFPVGHSTNLVGLPTGLLASATFNDYPQPLHIAGVRETNPALFRMLEDATCREEGAEAFEKYMMAVFGIQPAAPGRPLVPHRFRSSYRLLLQGWGFDANGPQGAVLKGWVESRFGLMPTFHKEALGHYPSATWMAYVEEKMNGRYHNNSIHLQLDLLYEFGQWMMEHYWLPGRQHLTLYRGVNDLEEHQIIERVSKREAIVRQNNLVSFSDSREVADQFGDTILEVQVPRVKVLFFHGLLPGAFLSGEGEHLVLGGDYRVRMTYF